ncbi:MAG: MBOAT family protein [Planctomycetia bacterium]|nr:MBOAT family protein [Planctomycetia bacterium]
MLFPSEIFLFVFLPFVLFTYYCLLFKWRSLQNVFLLVMSLLFYAYGEPSFVFVMMISIVMNWAFGLLVDRFRGSPRATKSVLVAMLLCNLGILAYFKYWMFVLGNINHFTGSYIPIPKITLPIGISFFTFQAISYVLDIYRGKGQAQKNPLNVGLYISFFPQLIAGPIVRYETIAEQIKHRNESLDDFSEGVCRFIVGLGKKVLVANHMAIVADAAFALPPGELSVGLAWLGALAYTFQIYFDFSGYSDMAIGLGRMFGFRFLENFNYPYISTSISEFWRRWHMSLSSFFRDYVYIPLGGNRVSTPRLGVNLFAVWALTGLWHGADWAFVLWGLLFFVFLVFEKLIKLEKRWNAPWQIPMKVFYTMLIVVVGWVLFKSGFDASVMEFSKGNTFHSLTLAGSYLQTMFGFSTNVFWDDLAHFHWHETRYVYCFAVLFSFPVVPWLVKKYENSSSATAQNVFSVLYTLLYCGLFILSVTFIAKGGYNPFIYFNF